MGKSKDLADLGDFGGVVHSVDADGNVVLRHDNTSADSRLSVQQTDQRLDLGSYWEAGVAQYSYINTTNAAGTNAQSLQLRTGGTTRMTIDASGRVTMPYQPYARASCSTVTSATQRIPLNSHNAYRGGMSIDNTNNRITVPASGAYVMGYAHLGNSGSGNTQIEIRINGASEHGTRIQTTGNNNDNGSSQWIKELSANDYIEFWCIQGAAHGNSSYNSMWAYLLG